MKKILTTIILLCTCLSVYAEEDTPEMILAKYKNILPYTKIDKCFRLYTMNFLIEDYKILETKDYTITKKIGKELEDLFVNKLGGNFDGLKNNDGSIDEDTIALYISYLKDHSNVSPLKRDIAESLSNLGYREGYIQIIYLSKLLREKSISQKDKDFIDTMSKYYTTIAHREIMLVEDLGVQSDLLEKYPIKIKDNGVEKDIIIETISNLTKDTLQVILKANNDYKKQMIEFVINEGEVRGVFNIKDIYNTLHNKKTSTALDKPNFQIDYLSGGNEIIRFANNTKFFLYYKKDIMDVFQKTRIKRDNFLECYIPDFDKIIKEPTAEKQSTNKQAPKTEKKQ